MSVRTDTSTGRLAGKVDVVTGAGAGIGEATAIAIGAVLRLDGGASAA